MKSWNVVRSSIALSICVGLLAACQDRGQFKAKAWTPAEQAAVRLAKEQADAKGKNPAVDGVVPPDPSADPKLDKDGHPIPVIKDGDPSQKPPGGEETEKDKLAKGAQSKTILAPMDAAGLIASIKEKLSRKKDDDAIAAIQGLEIRIPVAKENLFIGIDANITLNGEPTFLRLDSQPLGLKDGKLGLYTTVLTKTNGLVPVPNNGLARVDATCGDTCDDVYVQIAVQTQTGVAYGAFLLKPAVDGYAIVESNLGDALRPFDNGMAGEQPPPKKDEPKAGTDTGKTGADAGGKADVTPPPPVVDGQKGDKVDPKGGDQAPGGTTTVAGSTPAPGPGAKVSPNAKLLDRKHVGPGTADPAKVKAKLEEFRAGKPAAKPVAPPAVPAKPAAPVTPQGEAKPVIPKADKSPAHTGVGTVDKTGSAPIAPAPAAPAPGVPAPAAPAPATTISPFRQRVAELQSKGPVFTPAPAAPAPAAPAPTATSANGKFLDRKHVGAGTGTDAAKVKAKLEEFRAMKPAAKEAPPAPAAPAPTVTPPKADKSPAHTGAGTIDKTSSAPIAPAPAVPAPAAPPAAAPAPAASAPPSTTTELTFSQKLADIKSKAAEYIGKAAGQIKPAAKAEPAPTVTPPPKADKSPAHTGAGSVMPPKPATPLPEAKPKAPENDDPNSLYNI